MTEESTKKSDMSHALSKLLSAQRSLDRVDGCKTVKQNLKYIIEDLEVALKEGACYNDQSN